MWAFWLRPTDDVHAPHALRKALQKTRFVVVIFCEEVRLAAHLPTPHPGADLASRVTAEVFMQAQPAMWVEYQQVGYQQIDQEHRGLSKVLRHVVAAVCSDDATTTRDKLALLLGDVEKHFANEEALMAKHRYPLAERHAQAHRGFLRDAVKHQQMFLDDGLTPTFRRWVLERLTKWFQFHIQANDVALGRFLSALEQDAGQPPAA